MQDIVKNIINKNEKKIVLCVLDGLGGLPMDGKTELEYANTPNLDKLATESSCGLHLPVGRGITPGSGAAHLGLFGYDPLVYEIGRGVLEALGLGVDLGPSDLAIRGNFATVEYGNGRPVVTDRRAGRIPTDENKRIIAKLSENIDEIDGVKASFYPGMEHRFVLKLTFPDPIQEGGDLINDTDPQETGKPPLVPKGKNKHSSEVAVVLQKFIDKIAESIKDEEFANYTLFRGISIFPNLDSFEDVYGLKAGCIATYPMYRGVSKLVGMEVLEVEGNSIISEVETLKREINNYDFIFLHVKKTDSYGEDGDFAGKAGVIEEFDALIPQILSLEPDVFVVTGDHSTPATMKVHSWHPVPLLINSPYPRLGHVPGFNEKACSVGSLGIIKAVEIMPLLLAHADKLKKYGA